MPQSPPPSTARAAESRALRVALVGPGAPALQHLIGPSIVVTGVHPVARVLTARRLDVDAILLVTNAPARDMAALATSAVSLPPVLVLTRMGQIEAVAVLRAGALGLLVEGEYTRAELLEAIRATTRGESRLSPGALTAVVSHLHRANPADDTERQPLSRREREIMDLVAAGVTNRSIAGRLSIADKTVRNQVSRIYRKLGVRNRAEAVVSWLGRP